LRSPQWQEALEQAMLKCIGSPENVQEKLRGKTIVLVDVSGSMTAPLSHRSEMQRTGAAYGLAVLLREIGESASRCHECRLGDKRFRWETKLPLQRSFRRAWC
jgi:hypothetical protein